MYLPFPCISLYFSWVAFFAALVSPPRPSIRDDTYELINTENFKLPEELFKCFCGKPEI